MSLGSVKSTHFSIICVSDRFLARQAFVLLILKTLCALLLTSVIRAKNSFRLACQDCLTGIGNSTKPILPLQYYSPLE